jgi:hypothetical protein
MLTAVVAFMAIYLVLRSWRLVALAAIIAYALS